ncbi:hypothetical protein FO440_02110 [Mucilaginibacter corticis]|uniref:Macroglobulin domain-containing protein n=1 Tax=Mucilaginibacter corticis TaxID=2597670 RepID=A0A556MT76_9SPHI|nr:hypothetical protein [Mucilaginibacter corticis]TSJ43008.1 hypothetical protein FO440_02110 [Mucilaginibacter corticis]
MPITNLLAQVLPDVQKSFEQYHSTQLQEKLFVHTDKNTYTVGELMWIKIYCVDGIAHKPLDFSKVAYIEVLDGEHRPVLQAKISMQNGTGNGSVYLPVTLPSGNFSLRAYTSWMKNFSPDYYYNKQLIIINPLKSPDKQVAISSTDYDIQFFPEGGNLVNGITSTVGFKMADQWGKGLPFVGAVIDEKNDTVVKFKPLKFGIGHFSFKPNSSKTYKAIIDIGGKIIQKNLPAINSNGYVMSVKNDGNDILSVTVNTNLPTENVYLFTHTHNVIKEVDAATTDNGVAHFNIAKSKLGDGISQLTLFNNARKPVAERLYFKRPAKTLAINGGTEQQQYAVRKKVAVNINAASKNGDPAMADLSLSVYRLDSLQHPFTDDISSSIWLSSDLKGYVESPGYYFQQASAENDEAIDNLMLTQGWRKFNWNDVLTNKQPAFNFLPEHNGPIVTAQVTNNTNKAAQNVLAYLSIPGKRIQLYTSVSDSLGRLIFNMKNFYGPGELVLQPNTTIDTTYHFEIKSPFSDQYDKINLPPFTVTAAMQPLFKELSRNMQVQNIYNAAKARQFYDPEVDSTAFFGPPYKTYLLDYYTRFATIDEVLREYISEVNIRHTKNDAHIMIHMGTEYLSPYNPMVMLDGVPFFNMKKVFSFDPFKIYKLETVPYTYYYGATDEDGILSFSTFKGDLGGTEIDPHAVIVDYDGLELQRQFYSPQYDTEKAYNSLMPDFRNLLYWSPDVKTDAQGKNNISFYTSDLPGRYIGIIQGFTANGETGSQYFMFDVTK